MCFLIVVCLYVCVLVCLWRVQDANGDNGDDNNSDE